MLLVSRKEQESPEALIRRFNKMVQRDGERRAARRRRRAMVKTRRPRMSR